METSPTLPARALVLLTGPEPCPTLPFAREEIVAGPDCSRRVDDGKPFLETRASQYDWAELKPLLQGGKVPEVLIVVGSTEPVSFPRGVDRFPGKRILIPGPVYKRGLLTTFVNYARCERFDLIALDEERAALEAFAELSPRRLWLPGLRATVSDGEVPEAGREVIFLGRRGEQQAYRQAVGHLLTAASLTVHFPEEGEVLTPTRLARAAAVVHLSAGCELPPALFTALGAGALVLSQRLDPACGIPVSATETGAMVTFGDPRELLEKLALLFEDPAQLRDHRFAAQRWGRGPGHPAERRRQMFASLAHPPSMAMKASPVKMNTADFARVDFLRDLHARSTQVTVFGGTERLVATLSMLLPLPRLRWQPVNAIGSGEEGPLPAYSWQIDGQPCAQDVLCWPEKADTLAMTKTLAAFRGAYVIAPQVGEEVTQLLAEYGFSRQDGAAGLFACVAPLKGVAKALALGERDAVIERLEVLASEPLGVGSLLECARFAEAVEESSLVAHFLELAVKIDRTAMIPRKALARVQLARGEADGARISFAEVARAGELEAIDRALVEAIEVSEHGTFTIWQNYANELAPVSALPDDSKHRWLCLGPLFPPQERPGEPERLWEWTRALQAAGDEILIGTSNAPAMSSLPDPLWNYPEAFVDRSLGLLATFIDGPATPLTDPQLRQEVAKVNAETVEALIEEFSPDGVLLGDVEFLGVPLLETLTSHALPILHLPSGGALGYPARCLPPGDGYHLGAIDPEAAVRLRRVVGSERVSLLPDPVEVMPFRYGMAPSQRGLRIVVAASSRHEAWMESVLGAFRRLHREGTAFSAEVLWFGSRPSDIEESVAAPEGPGAPPVRFHRHVSANAMRAHLGRANALLLPEDGGVFGHRWRVRAGAAGLAVVTGVPHSEADDAVHIEGPVLPYAIGDEVALARTLRGLLHNRPAFEAAAIRSAHWAEGFAVGPATATQGSLAQGRAWLVQMAARKSQTSVQV